MPLQIVDPTTSAAEVAELLRQDGALIVRDVLSPEEVECINRETSPWIEATPGGRDDFSGRLTRRTGALVVRCPDVARQ